MLSPWWHHCLESQLLLDGSCMQSGRRSPPRPGFSRMFRPRIQSQTCTLSSTYFGSFLPFSSSVRPWDYCTIPITQLPILRCHSWPRGSPFCGLSSIRFYRNSTDPLSSNHPRWKRRTTTIALFRSTALNNPKSIFKWQAGASIKRWSFFL